MPNLSERIAALSPEQRRAYERLLKKKREEKAQRRRRIPRFPDDAPCPATPDQAALWFYQQLEPESTAYNIGNGLRIFGEIDPELFERALAGVVERQEILRTTYRVIDGQPYLRVLDRIELPLTVFDLRDFPEAEREAELQRINVETLKVPFDMENEPLWRFSLVRVRDREYLLAPCLHHSITDSLAYDIFFREIFTFYAALHEGVPVTLPPLPIRFRDYAAWRSGWMSSPDYDRQQSYWLKQLAGAPTSLPLPLDRPRPTLPTFNGAREYFTFPVDLIRQIRTRNKQHGVTPLMTLQAALLAFLYRYTGANDLLIGGSASLRDEDETDSLIGYLLNPIVMRGQLSASLSFAELLAQQKKTVLDGFAHRHFPFHRVVQELAPARDVNRMPLIQVEFVYVSGAGRRVHKDSLGVDLGVLEHLDLTAAGYSADRRTSESDLQFTFQEWDDEMGFFIEHSTDILLPETVRRMGRLFLQLLRAMVSAPERPITAHGWLDEAEVRQLLAVRDHLPPTDGPELVHRGFEPWARQNPDAVAVAVPGDEAASRRYGQLERRVQEIAARLIGCGVGPDLPVAIFLDRSPRFLEAALGILSAGGCYLYLDPSHPRERHRSILAEANPRAVLTTSDLCRRLPPSRAEVFALDRLPALTVEAVEAMATTPIAKQPALRPDHLAYIIYTSGSTGQPKGVGVSHRGVTTFLRDFIRRLDLQPDQRFLTAASFSFDAHVPEVFAPLWSGGTAVVLDNVLGLTDRRAALDTVVVPPSALLALLREQTLPSSIRTVILGGEAVPAPLVAKLQDLTDPPRYFNFYGPTEVSVACTYQPMEPGRREAPTLGRPFAGAGVLILDSVGHPRPAGLPGELALSGPGLARGYVFRGDLTAERFVPHPMAGEPGQRLYHTGDLARLRPDGDLEFLGRVDSQVKVRGFRIELGEIEATLMRLPGIGQAAARLWPRPDGDVTLVAYATATEAPAAEATTHRDLRTELGTLLPAYMVPDQVIWLESLPLAASGKIDRRSLPEPGAPPPEDYVAPVGEVEEALVEVWGSVLDAPQVGRHDRFFDLGGHSLKATQVASRVARRLGRQVDLKDIFTSADLADLANRIQQRPASSQEPIRLTPVRPDYPLSHAQKRLWLTDRLAGGSAYNMTEAMRLEGRFQPEALASAVQAMVGRHESLRTRFLERDGEPRQVILRQRPASWVEEDLRDLEHEAQDHRVREAFAAERDTPFDLESDSLLRVRLLRRSDRRWVLIFTMHHIIGDGWSMRIFHRELIALYLARVEGRPQPLAPLAVQYKDYAVWQVGRDFTAEAAYWSQWLQKPCAPLPLPRDFSSPTPGFAGETLHDRLDPRQTAAIQRYARVTGTTLSNVVLAAFHLLLARLCDVEETMLAVSVANRNHADLEPVIGFFVNPLLTRVAVPRRVHFADLVAAVDRETLAAYQHQDYPFDLLVAENPRDREQFEQSWFNVSYVFQNFADVALEAPADRADELDFAVRPLEGADQNTAKFDLTLFVSDAEGALELAFEFRRELYARESMSRYLGVLTRFLRSIAEAGDGEPDPKSFRLLDPTVDSREFERVIHDFNRARPALGESPTVIEGFRDIARAHPDRTALRQDSRELTYRELAAEVDVIARFIHDLDLPPEAAIAVLADNTIGLVSALLASLEAGRPFVPLNPALPFDRLRLMLEDAAPPLLIFEKRHVAAANRFQWKCPSLRHILVLDSSNVHWEIEPASALGQRELWEWVGSQATDSVEGGGWTDSYTGEPLSEAEMTEYADNAYRKLAPYLTPETRVVEIGCASGITLFRLAPHVGFTVGTDFSAATLEQAESLRRERQLSNVRFARLAAHEIDGLEERDFDLVVINSVVQSFNGHNYLLDVLAKAIDLIGDRGVIFLGDLMDLELEEALVASLENYQRAHPEAATKTDWSQELFVSKDFLNQLIGELPELVAVEHSPKIGTLENELTRFRFDSLLRIDKSATPVATSKSRWQHDRRDLEPASGQVSGPGPSRESAAYLMYTSGSTGRPKGVTVSQVNLAHHLAWAASAYFDGQPAKMALFTSPGFDLTITSLFTPLLTGGCLTVFPDLPIDRLLAAVFEHPEVEAVKLTPSHISALSHLDLEETSVELAICGGEPLADEHVSTLRALNPRMRILNEYGPTEATVGCTVETVEALPATLGQPIADAEILVLDRDLEPLPIAVPGELCVGGPGVARGYHLAPGTTAARFVPHPFNLGDRLYRTGDRAKWRADGRLIFLGRTDRQAKIRGNRIELGECEALLRHMPEIRDAVVALTPAGSGLLAHLIPRASAISAEQLMSLLSQRLPAFMVPSRLNLVDEFPVTANGKLNLRALNALAESAEGPSGELPQGPIETSIAEIWAQVLELPSIDRHQHFFKSGGHSLTAVRAAALLTERLGREVPLAAFFQAPSVAGLAAHLEAIWRYQTDHVETVGRFLTAAKSEREHGVVFCFPPILGFADAYRPLAEHLETVGFYAFDFTEQDSPLQVYRQAIKAVQPSGPYRFYGYSAGGNVAFEMAKLFESRGDVVDGVILADSRRTSPQPSDPAGEAAELEEIFAAMAGDPQWRELTANNTVKAMIADKLSAYISYFHRMDNSGSIAADLFFLAAQPRPRDPDRAPAWADATSGRFEVVRSRSTHSEMFGGDHLVASVAVLKRWLQRSHGTV